MVNHGVHARGTVRGTRWPLATAGLLAAVAVTNAWVLSGIRLPWIGPAAGFLFAVCLPAWMLSQKVDWWTDQLSERLGYSVVGAVLALVLVGLALNTVLPHLGVPRPLDRGPVLAGIDVWCVALWLWRHKRFRPALPRPRLERLGGLDRMIGGTAALCVPAAIIGAVRLNNGAGDGVTLAMLITVACVFTLLLTKRKQLNPGTITAAIYFISLAMLLMTSLRGWYTTGHDIQAEYRVFELTKTNGDWNISRFQNAYNACMSITILPTMLWQVTRVDDPYIYKFFFQLLFALCPVFVYRITRRRLSSALAIIAAIYFVAFPTYFQDMPFLNRQEIAFLFVAACMLLATDTAMPLRACRIKIGLFSVGVVLSHYSTAYVFAGTLVLGWIGYRSWRLIVAIRRRLAVIEISSGACRTQSPAPHWPGQCGSRPRRHCPVEWHRHAYRERSRYHPDASGGKLPPRTFVGHEIVGRVVQSVLAGHAVRFAGADAVRDEHPGSDAGRARRGNLLSGKAHQAVPGQGRHGAEPPHDGPRQAGRRYRAEGLCNQLASSCRSGQAAAASRQYRAGSCHLLQEAPIGVQCGVDSPRMCGARNRGATGLAARPLGELWSAPGVPPGSDRIRPVRCDWQLGPLQPGRQEMGTAGIVGNCHDFSSFP